ncbi:MAG: YgiT-type zinc finger protein [archaeon]
MRKEINCHLCHGKARLKFEELELNEGKIIIKDSPYYECLKCHEKFATSKQMRELFKRKENISGLNTYLASEE